MAARSWVLAATVIVHGALWATLLVPTVSPELPAEVEMNTPAAAALKNATSSGVTMNDDEPEML